MRLGGERAPGEGLRLGTVRRPPRGVPKAEIAARGFYDLWLPELAPSEALVKAGRAAGDERQWRAFARRYQAEMKQPREPAARPARGAVARDGALGGLLLCRRGRCHRSLLRELLAARGATIV